MGRDKASLAWGSHTLLEQARQQLSAAGAARVVTCGRSGPQDAVPDTRGGEGPLSALAQLVPHLDDGIIVVVPVDMPLLSAALLRQLLHTDAVCAAFGSHPLPLMLRLCPAVRDSLQALSQLAAPQRSLRALQHALGAKLLDDGGWQAQLRGCNTPEEWEALRRSPSFPPSVNSN